MVIIDPVVFSFWPLPSGNFFGPFKRATRDPAKWHLLLRNIDPVIMSPTRFVELLYPFLDIFVQVSYSSIDPHCDTIFW